LFGSGHSRNEVWHKRLGLARLLADGGWLAARASLAIASHHPEWLLVRA